MRISKGALEVHHMIYSANPKVAIFHSFCEGRLADPKCIPSHQRLAAWQAIESRMDELLRRQSSLERNVSESLKRHKEDHAELLSTLRGRQASVNTGIGTFWDSSGGFGDQGRDMCFVYLFFSQFWLKFALFFPEIFVTLWGQALRTSKYPMKAELHVRLPGPSKILRISTSNYCPSSWLQWPDFKMCFSFTFCTYMMASLACEGWQERDQPSFGHEAGHRWHNTMSQQDVTWYDQNGMKSDRFRINSWFYSQLFMDLDDLGDSLSRSSGKRTREGRRRRWTLEPNLSPKLMEHLENSMGTPMKLQNFGCRTRQIY